MWNAVVGAAVISAVATVLGAVLPLLIQNRKLKARIEGAPIVARGVAVGYFFNFLEKVSDALKLGSVRVRFPPDEERIAPAAGSADRIHEFKRDDVEIILIVPKHLSADSFNQAEKEAGESRTGAMLLVADGKRINYDLVQNGNRLKLLIKDLVRPYFAIKHYAEEYLDLNEDSDDWRKLEQDTLGEFHKTIEKLRSKGEGVAVNQISWKEIG